MVGNKEIYKEPVHESHKQTALAQELIPLVLIAAGEVSSSDVLGFVGDEVVGAGIICWDAIQGGTVLATTGFMMRLYTSSPFFGARCSPIPFP